jgi:hypothetical protein
MNLQELEQKIKDIKNQLIPLEKIDETDTFNPYLDLGLFKNHTKIIKNNFANNNFIKDQKKIRILKTEIRKLKENILDVQSNPQHNCEMLDTYNNKILEKELELKSISEKPIKKVNNMDVNNIDVDVNNLETENLFELKETLETELEYLEDKYTMIFDETIKHQEQLKLQEAKENIKLQKILEKKQKLNMRRIKVLNI